VPGAFKPWARPKPRIAALLEAAANVDLRVAAMRALTAFSAPSVAELRSAFLQKVAGSLGRAPEVGKEDCPHSYAAPAPTMEILRQAQERRPFIYTPVVTSASTAARGPWEGSRAPLRCVSVSGGFSPLLSAAAEAGVMPVEENEASSLATGHTLLDPQEFPWAHVLLVPHIIHPSADTAAVTMRALLIMAVQRPWCAVFDFSPRFRLAQDGAPWRLFQGLLTELGFVVLAVEICPSSCVDFDWVSAATPPRGCRGT
jgi:hypothetical protein